MLRVTNARSLLGALMRRECVAARVWRARVHVRTLFEDLPGGRRAFRRRQHLVGRRRSRFLLRFGLGRRVRGARRHAGQGGSDEQPPFTCFPLEVDDATSFFVTLSGEDSETCGSRSFPCRTIQRAIDRAALGSEIDHVYVATGSYAESLELRPGITLEGGVSAFGSTGDFEWTLACSHEDQVVLAGAEARARRSSPRICPARRAS